jgi:hypothetical protein
MFRTNPGTWKLRVFWKHTHPEIAQNLAKPPENTENRLMPRPKAPQQQWGCVPASEHYSKIALVPSAMSPNAF